jgi:hypothetical protein
VSHRWISTVAGRVGLVNDRWLVFAKLGGGWVQSDATVNVPGSPSWNGSSTNGGWLIGGGIEYGFKAHWTVKLEYDYLALSSWNSATVPAVGLSRDVQMIKAGINYKFESGFPGGAEPSRAGRPGAPTKDEDLQKASQNPIADLVSVPFQSNTNFNSGPFNRTQEVLNIQPVVPMHLGENWNVISRTIIPLISQPDPLRDSSTNGIGDITQSLFLSPAHPGELIWGVGPVFTVPSASDPILGTGKVLFGPTAVFLMTPGHWVIGVLLNNQWSVGGNPLRPAVNSFLAQPFVNYNMERGWYLTTSPIITANWLAAPGEKWTVPIGGSVDPKTTTCLTPPRPILACKSSDGTSKNQTCKDEGPLTLDRSKTVDEEISAKVIDFLDRNDPRRTNKPFFVWYNPARMHVTTGFGRVFRGVINQ